MQDYTGLCKKSMYRTLLKKLENDAILELRRNTSTPTKLSHATELRHVTPVMKMQEASKIHTKI